MSLSIALDDPGAPGPRALLEQSHALMRALYPAEANHFLSIAELRAPEIAFFSARLDGGVVGTAALKNANSYGEVKSMFVAERVRGRGVGEALLARLDAEARVRGLAVLRLETGDTLHAAHRLYARAGFAACAPFGDYLAAPTSLFMEKRLA